MSGDGEPTSLERKNSAAAQMVEHIDGNADVIEIVTRAEMREHVLRHRSTWVAVVDVDDRILVHKRAGWKDVFPGAWDLAFGGVCDVDEQWHESALRELEEEAGITGELVECASVSFESPRVKVVGRLFVCRHSGPFRFGDGEVTATQWIRLGDLAEFVAANEIPDDSAAVITEVALRPFL